MLKAVSARRGMPFEWSFLLDALQTERDQGITHRHHADPLPHQRARSRADRCAGPRGIPAQHDHRRLAGRCGGADHRRRRRRARPDPPARLSAASARHSPGRGRHQQDGSRRFQPSSAIARSATRFPRISSGLGVTPTAVIPISARDGDGVAARTPSIGWYAGPTVVEALDQLTPARPMDRAAAAAADPGGLQVRRSPHHRRPRRIRLAQGRRRNRHHAGGQDRAGSRRSKAGR